MASWLIPALKAVLPHIGDVLSAAKPVFTRKPPEPGTNATSLLQQQIIELQTAAQQNSAHIKELAEQLQRTVAALEQAAAAAEQRLRRAVVFCATSTAVSVLALALALFAALVR